MKQSQTKTITIILLSAILILLVTLIGLVMYFNQETLKIIIDRSQYQALQETPIIPPTPQEVSEFRMDYYSNKQDLYLLDAYNKTIAIESLNTACKERVSEYVNDNIGQLFFVRDYVADDITPPKKIFVVNGTEKTCTLLKISNEVGEFGGYRISPDNTKIAVSLESNPYIITVLDLQTDTARVVARTKEGETFNAGWGGLLNNFVFLWDDEKTLQYDTFLEVAQTPYYVQNGKPLVSTQLIEIE